MLLDQCKMKNEDFDKFKRDKLHANILEKKKEISKSTVRSSAGSALKEISCKILTLESHLYSNF